MKRCLLVLLIISQQLAAQQSLRVFMIGNSFSQNASTYLKQIAADGGRSLTLGRAEMGGCSLQRHWDSVVVNQQDPSRGKAYSGKSLRELLSAGTWDVISIQQYSQLSGDKKTYQPYADDLVAFIKSLQPRAEIVVHQTWAYRADAKSFGKIDGERRAANDTEMWEYSRAAYKSLAEKFHFRIIPSGDAFHAMAVDPKWHFIKDDAFDPKKSGLPVEKNSLHRGYSREADGTLKFDPNHANAAGCYLAGLVWYARLFHSDPTKIKFHPDDLADSLVNKLRITAASVSGEGLEPVKPPDPDRVKQFGTLLPANPRGFGDRITERKVWDGLYATGKFAGFIQQADSISKIAFPELSEEIYMSFYKGKDSETSKRFIMQRRMLLSRLVWAECLTNKGKYLPAITKALQSILASKSWSFPAEDGDKTNWNGTKYTIGLSSSAYGSDIAQTYYLLGPVLPQALKIEMRQKLQERIFDPVLNAVSNGNSSRQFGSLTNTGNHNSVELANVLAAAFAVIEDKNQRAVYAAIAEQYSQNFLLGYLDDGYCTEGIGYYSYGFIHYVFLRELLLQGTNGAVDLFNRPRVAKMLRFAPAMEIINDVYPAISDCEQNMKPSPQLMNYVYKTLGAVPAEYRQISPAMEQPALIYLALYFPNAASNAKQARVSNVQMPLRDYFQEAGVLTVRPASINSKSLGACFKGGDNAEQHNHNDLGTYTIVAGNELLTGDAGLATYTPKYFTKERFQLFKTAASYGHNVPLINGVQQKEGSASKAKIIRTSFSPERDEIKMDLTSAYPGANLSKLERNFEYKRGADQQVTVTSTYKLNSLGTFEDAIITRFPWKLVRNQQSSNESDRGRMMLVEIQGFHDTIQLLIKSSTEKIVLIPETINEGPAPYTRLAMRQSDVSEGEIEISISRKHAAPQAVVRPQLLFNSGFEGNTIMKASKDKDVLSGIDQSVPAPNNWDRFSSKGGYPEAGVFTIYTEGGDSLKRKARIVQDPSGARNKALRFTVYEPNAVHSASDTVPFKTRMQGQCSGSNPGITKYYQKVRMYFPSTTMKLLDQYPDDITWYSLAEFWNNSVWGEVPPDPFRLTVGMGHKKGAGNPFYFHFGCDDYSIRFKADGKTPEKYIPSKVVGFSDTSFHIPSDTWITVEYYYQEGGWLATAARPAGHFYMTVQAEGQPRKTLFNKRVPTIHTKLTHEPDGLANYHPLKFYTNKEIAAYMKSKGVPLEILWDDLEIWSNKVPDDPLLQQLLSQP